MKGNGYASGTVTEFSLRPEIGRAELFPVVTCHLFGYLDVDSWQEGGDTAFI